MCAAVLKSWREAATLILVNTRRKMPQSLGEIKPTTGGSELEVLVLKQNKKPKNMYVFPGGTAANSDFSREWLDLFGNGYPESAANQFSFAKPLVTSAPMFHRQRLPEFRGVPSEIAFRICAIRETFEESGVLLARSADVCTLQYNPSPVQAYTDCENHESMVEEWRQRVKRDPAEFLNLCKSLDVLPDIWSIYDWSNWLTPTEEKTTQSKGTQGTRFDAAFYISCLKERPFVAEYAFESGRAQWARPSQLIKDYNENRVELAPPQLYEASRLVNFRDVDDLLCFLKKRAGQPTERWMPVRIQCADAILYTFPGDALYPCQPDLHGEHPVLSRKETLEELTFFSGKLNQAVLSLAPTAGTPGAQQQFRLQCNIKQPHGHVAPFWV